ncbi:hypothetical protein PR048_010490 [Dryococelus australis]|uniref:Uncharacterized protein n=1 Tax=Dryococelus australis TaxID=614101 RepID=A0ABQ9I2X4_9NEOP|nr:hypothetical protein PR048_010490 [Dryococelus australis]
MSLVMILTLRDDGGGHEHPFQTGNLSAEKAPNNKIYAWIFEVRLENNMAAREGVRVSTECTSSFILPLALSPRSWDSREDSLKRLATKEPGLCIIVDCYVDTVLQEEGNKRVLSESSNRREAVYFWDIPAHHANKTQQCLENYTKGPEHHIRADSDATVSRYQLTMFPVLMEVLTPSLHRSASCCPLSLSLSLSLSRVAPTYPPLSNRPPTPTPTSPTFNVADAGAKVPHWLAYWLANRLPGADWRTAFRQCCWFASCYWDVRLDFADSLYLTTKQVLCRLNCMLFCDLSKQQFAVTTSCARFRKCDGSKLPELINSVHSAFHLAAIEYNPREGDTLLTIAVCGVEPLLISTASHRIESTVRELEFICPSADQTVYPSMASANPSKLPHGTQAHAIVPAAISTNPGGSSPGKHPPPGLLQPRHRRKPSSANQEQGHPAKRSPDKNRFYFYFRRASDWSASLGSRRVWSSAGMKGETGEPRENLPTNGIVRHDTHLRKPGDPAGDLTWFALVGGERANRSATATLLAVEIKKNRNIALQNIKSCVFHYCGLFADPLGPHDCTLHMIFHPGEAQFFLDARQSLHRSSTTSRSTKQSSVWDCTLGSRVITAGEEYMHINLAVADNQCTGGDATSPIIVLTPSATTRGYVFASLPHFGFSGFDLRPQHQPVNHGAGLHLGDGPTRIAISRSHSYPTKHSGDLLAFGEHTFTPSPSPYTHGKLVARPSAQFQPTPPPPPRARLKYSKHRKIYACNT